jgi:Glycerol-3-phosphate dehydrogenase
VVRVEHLLNRFGVLAEEIFELIAANPALGEPLPAAEDYLKAEIVYAASHEGARHLDDVLTRAPVSPSRPSTAVRAAPARPPI